MNKILKIKDLGKRYHTNNAEIVAIENISFDVFEGDFISIVGPSGCGKSTLLSIMSGIIPKSFGNIDIKDGYSIAYMLQDDSLLPFRTVLENCLIGLEITKKNTEENKKYVIKLLNTYGLGDFINKYPNSLSGGMRQRVALIRTLAIKPDILLLDEATSSLDYQTSLAISNDIYNIIKSEGKTAILVTHDIGLAISMSDKVYVLSKRPATIKKCYEIKIDKSLSPIERRMDTEFSYYYDKIWKDLDVYV